MIAEEHRQQRDEKEHDMNTVAMNQHNITLLEGIGSSCIEIQQSLKEHLETTTSSQYKADIEKDIVTLENLKCITVAIRTDIETGTLGASTELLLRIAANDFNSKLARIPEKKALRVGACKSLKEVHHNILQMTRAAQRSA
jgi:hypothetical protein